MNLVVTKQGIERLIKTENGFLQGGPNSALNCLVERLLKIR